MQQVMPLQERHGAMAQAREDKHEGKVSSVVSKMVEHNRMSPGIPL